MAAPYKVVLMLETSRGPERDILQGIIEYCSGRRRWAIHLKDPPYRDAAALNVVRAYGADGFLGIASDNASIRTSLKKGFPAVVIPSREEISGFVNVLEDRASSGRMAAEHLLERGLKHFAYCSFENFYWSNIRRDSFTAYLADKGHKAAVYEVPPDWQTAWSDEQPRMIHWLRSLPKPVGIMACNDDRGRQVLEACQLAGLQVPEEVALIGVDNDQLLCELAFPPLSSVKMNHRQIGLKAAEALEAMMAGRKPKARVIHQEPLHVVARQSTDVVATRDAVAQEAIRFIRANYRRRLTVEDVAVNVGMSRYDLHDRFSRAVGRSVGEEIRNVRVEHMRRFLVETDLPVAQIAKQAGYTDSTNVARFFREIVGMTPASYRKKYRRR